jgi:hypothetical protein
MAKGNTGEDDHAKVKVRVIEFELEGGNATAENSIRQLTTALTTRNSAPKPLPPKITKELPPPAEDSEETVDAEFMEPEPATNGDSHQPRKATKVKSKPKAPNYLPDLLSGDKLTGFKEFAKEKNPSGRSKQYLTRLTG